MSSFSQLRKNLAVRLTDPVIDLLERTPVTPSALTVFGFILSVAGAVLIASDKLFAAGIVVILAGFFDMLDGALARRTGTVTRFGAILDSVLDRLSEAALLVGAMFLFASEGEIAAVWITGAAMATSQLVSYLRARAEALGIECLRGIFTRPERVIIMVLGLLLDQLLVAMAIIAIFSVITAAQRVSVIRQGLKE